MLGHLGERDDRVGDHLARLLVAAVDWWAVSDPSRRRIELIAKPLTLVVLIGAAAAVTLAALAWFVRRRHRRTP